MIDNQLSWHAQGDRVNISFSKKVGVLRRMSYLSKSVLEEIYFKPIIPSVTNGIVVWANCSQPLLNSLDYTHAQACRIINHLPSSLESTWLPIKLY